MLDEIILDKIILDEIILDKIVEDKLPCRRLDSNQLKPKHEPGGLPIAHPDHKFIIY